MFIRIAFILQLGIALALPSLVTAETAEALCEQVPTDINNFARSAYIDADHEQIVGEQARAASIDGRKGAINKLRARIAAESRSGRSERVAILKAELLQADVSLGQTEKDQVS